MSGFWKTTYYDWLAYKSAYHQAMMLNRQMRHLLFRSLIFLSHALFALLTFPVRFAALSCFKSWHQIWGTKIPHSQIPGQLMIIRDQQFLDAAMILYKKRKIDAIKIEILGSLLSFHRQSICPSARLSVHPSVSSLRLLKRVSGAS